MRLISFFVLIFAVAGFILLGTCKEFNKRERPKPYSGPAEYIDRDIDARGSQLFLVTFKTLEGILVCDVTVGKFDFVGMHDFGTMFMVIQKQRYRNYSTCDVGEVLK